MKHKTTVAVVCAMLASATVFLMADTTPAVAVGQVQTIDGNGNRIQCADLEAAKGGVILGYIVPCLTKTIETTTKTFTEKMIEWLRPLMFAFITFVVVMFGVKTLQAEGEVHKEGLLLLLKIGLVLAFLEMIPTLFIPSIYGMMTESQEVVMGAIKDNSMHCDMEKYRDGNTPMIWAQMDCLVGKLYGFTTGTNGQPNMVLASSVFGLLGGFFFGGTLGVTLFFACIGVLWTIFSLVLKMVFAFVNAYFYISILLILSPLILPLVLMRTTVNYFEPWWKGIVASMLMPVVVSGYVMIALIAYDKMLFADDALIKNLFDHEWVKKGQELSRQACDRQLTREPTARSVINESTEEELMKNPFLQNFVKPFLSAGNNQCAGMMVPQLNLESMDENGADFKTAKEGFEKLFRDCIKLLFMAWLIKAGFDSMLRIVQRVIGSPTVAMALQRQSQEEIQIARGMERGRAALYGAFQTDGDGNPATYRGTEFLKRLPVAAGESAKGFLAGFSKSATPSAAAPPRDGGQTPPDAGDGEQPGSDKASSAPATLPKPPAGVRAAAMTPPQRQAAAQEAFKNPQDLARFQELEAKGNRTTEEEGEYQKLLDDIDGRSSE